MFENPRRGRQAKNLTKNVPKFLDLKSSSEKVFSENWRWVLLFFFFCRHSNSYPVECKHSAVARGLQDFNCSCSVSYSRRVLGIPEWVRISNALYKYIVLFMVHSEHFFFFHFWLGLISRTMINYCTAQIWKMFTQHSLYGHLHDSVILLLRLRLFLFFVPYWHS